MAADLPSRRELFARAAGWALGAASLLLGLVAPLRSVFGVARRRTVRDPEGYLPLGRLSDFLPGVPEEVALAGESRDGWLREGRELGSVFVVREGGGATVFSSICPHLGCAVDWDESAHRFACPCHASLFAPDGRLLSGPAPRPLGSLPARVGPDGELSCRYLRFVSGLPEKRPA